MRSRWWALMVCALSSCALSHGRPRDAAVTDVVTDAAVADAGATRRPFTEHRLFGCNRTASPTGLVYAIAPPGTVPRPTESAWFEFSDGPGSTTGSSATPHDDGGIVLGYPMEELVSVTNATLRSRGGDWALGVRYPDRQAAGLTDVEVSCEGERCTIEGTVAVRPDASVIGAVALAPIIDVASHDWIAGPLPRGSRARLEATNRWSVALVALLHPDATASCVMLDLGEAP